ncbi:MAG TPA: copper homeostasis protein CutC [Firmicutes bacterium]|jgi:copper homeostasis protein|nr:copper homeostasis protein CutC [Bacillota bacterium]
MLVEVVCYTIEDVFRARKARAHRVELCADPGAGGTTPNYGFIKQSAKFDDIDTMVMIRPRGGDFLYNGQEILQMEDDIRLAAQLGVQGVVFGVLDETGSFDRPAMSRLVRLAKGLQLEITCHRAFDVARDPHESLQILIELGVDRLLTSGQQKTAVEGIPLIRELIKRAEGRISIMPGGGIRPEHAGEFLKLDVAEIHTGSKTKVPSRMKYAPSDVKMGSDDTQEYHWFVDVEAIKSIVETVRGERLC